MVTERIAIRILAIILIGGLFAAPAFARSLHRHASFNFNHGLQPHEITPPIASTNRPNEIHAIDGHEADNHHEAKTPDARQGTGDDAASGKQVVSPGRGPKQNAVDGDRQGGKWKEDMSGTWQGEVLPSDLRSGKPAPIDTSITVMGRGVAEERQPHPGRKSKFRLIIPGSIHAFYSRIPRTGHHSVRNAIGARVEASAGGRQGGDAAGSRPVAVRAPFAPIAPRPATGLTKNASGSDDRPPLVRSGIGPSTPLPAAGRATINGTGFARRGNGSPLVGGPARIVAGISGSMFRSRR